MGVGNRFAYGNVARGLIAKLLTELGFNIPASGPPASWSQATWFVDPQNVTGTASDTNSGIDAAHAVRSYNGGIVGKWGTTSPTLRQNTTITWLSSQPVGGADPVSFLPIMSGGIALIVGALPTPFRTGVLAGVVAKNRATATLLQASLGGPPPAVGVLVRNTTVGKESFAWVYQSGAPCALTQPIAETPLPSPTLAASATVDTWANGDTFELYNLIEVNMVQASTTVAAYVAPSFPNQLQIAHIKATTHDGIDGDDSFYFGGDTSLIEMSCNAFLISEKASSDTEFQNVQNVALLSGVDITAGVSQTVSMLGGCIIQPNVTGMCPWSFFNDAIIDTTAAAPDASLTIGSSIQLGNGQFAPTVIENLYLAGVVAVQGVARFGLGAGQLWGAGTLDAVGSARTLYQGLAVNTFQPGILLRLNGQANANTFVYATGVWSAQIALTQANLDDAVQLHGLAVNVGGATITSQNTV